MKFCFYTNSVSPHQLPLARELIKRLGEENYRYVTQNHVLETRLQCGWHDEEEAWIVSDSDRPQETRVMLESCDVLLCGVRDLALFETRARRRLLTLYASERWFKPIRYHFWRLPGWFRLFCPRYLKMSCCIRRLLRSNVRFYALPFGVHAAADMAFIAGWKRPKFSTLTPGAAFEKLRLWGYFVTPSIFKQMPNPDKTDPLRVLWVGRMFDLKRVDVIVKAVRFMVGEGVDVMLTLVGDGPEKQHLECLANGLPVNFLSSQPIDRIRRIMQEHDVFVFASNAEDGWGAVVNEALEEGMYTLGTHEPGASATMLDKKDLFTAGDWKALARLLMQCAQKKQTGELKGQGIGEWSVVKAVDKLLSIG